MTQSTLLREGGSERSIIYGLCPLASESFAANPFHLPSIVRKIAVLRLLAVAKITVMCQQQLRRASPPPSLSAASPFAFGGDGADSDILSNHSSSLHHYPNRAAGLLLLVHGKVGRPLR